MAQSSKLMPRGHGTQWPEYVHDSSLAAQAIGAVLLALLLEGCRRLAAARRHRLAFADVEKYSLGQAALSGDYSMCPQPEAKTAAASGNA